MENDDIPDDVILYASDNGDVKSVMSSYNGSTSVAMSSTLPSSFSHNALSSLRPRNQALARAEVAIQSVVLFLTLTGNGAVLTMLLSLSRYKDLGRMYTMIGHLSCADLFVALFNLLPQLIWDVTYRFRGGRVLCKLTRYIQVVAMYASAYVLVSTAVDRYIAICHPMRSHTWTSTTAHQLVSFAWLLSLVFSLPQLAIFDYVEILPGVGVRDCLDHFRPHWTLSVYVTWFTLAVYVIPLVVLATIYAKICAVVWQSASARTTPMINMAPTRSSGNSTPSTRGSTERHNCKYQGRLKQADNQGLSSNGQSSEVGSATRGGSQQGNAGLSRAKTKTVKLTLTVVVSYLVCWAPFFISQMWSAWDPQAPFEGPVMVIALLLASLNSCINPWIYLAFSDQLRRKATRCCRASRGQRPSTLSYESTDFRSGSRPTHS